MPAPSNTRLDDDDFDDFMQNNNIDQIVDLPVPDDQQQETRSNQPPLPQPAAMQQPKVNKGKSRMTLSQEMREVNATREDMDIDASRQASSNLPSWDNEPRSWEQMLPDDVFEDVDPLPDLSCQQGPSVQTPFANNAQRTPTPPPSHHPFTRLPSPTPLQPSASLMSENDFEDEFDFSLDASFLEQADALAKSKTELGFDDFLEPRFDFEKTRSMSGKENRAVTLIWPGRPPFSENGLQLLEERQKRLEARTGHRVFIKFKKPATLGAATGTSPLPQMQQRKTQQPSLIIDTPPRLPEKQQLDYSMEEPEEKAREDEFCDLEINEDMFANFLENKIDEDGYYAENFMFGQSETSTQNIAEQSILHADMATEQPSTSHEPIVLSYTQHAYPNNASPLSKSARKQSRKYQWFGDAATGEEDIIEFDVDALSSASDEESATTAPPPDVAMNNHDTLQRQPSIFSIEDSQDIPPSQQRGQDEQVELSEDEAAISPTVHKHRRKIIISEDEQESPSLLSALSKGLYTPSPLQRAADSESPVLVRRKLKRLLIEDDDDDEDGNDDGEEHVGEDVPADDGNHSKIKGRKRLKRKVTQDEDDDFVVLPPSQQELKRRLLQSREPSKKKHDKKRHRSFAEEGGLANPFVEYEADYSSDNGHTDEDVEGLYNSGASSALNSFIVDDDDYHSSIGNGSALSISDSIEPPMVMRTPEDDDPIRRIGKHWMNRFNADKWLNVNEEDDSVVVSEEEMGSEESINDFTSDLREPLMPIADDDDGDFA
ncbi:unnamed protein product [Mucor fragilis]